MLLVSLSSSVTVHLHHVENDRVMLDAINGDQSGHGIFEDAIPLGKDQFGGQHHGFAFVALDQEGEENLYLIAILLDIADIILDDTGETIQLSQFLWESPVPFPSEIP